MTDATPPVMVGMADGIDDVGRAVGVIVGNNVGAAVMKTSQDKKISFQNPIKIMLTSR